jgi:catechol 2,3-dioxygenase-like lactoylglutathione lyase family enzyme
MYLSHINLTIPKDGEATARMFYTGQLGLRELPKPESLLAHNELWFEAGGLTLHLSVQERRGDTDTLQHFGLGCGDVDGLKARLKAAGVTIEDCQPSHRKCFFIRDPFGNRIEIHAPGAQHI